MTIRQRWNQTSLPNKLLVIIGASAAAFTGLYAGATIIQISVMKRIARESGEQIERILNEGKRVADISAEQNRKAMEASAAQGKAALDASVMAARMDQRAWLGIKDITLSHPLAINHTIDISVNSLNSGKTPALGVRLVEISVGDTETHVVKTAPSADRGVVAPNNNLVFYSSATSPNDVIEGLMAGRFKVYVRGRLEYQDIFGTPHKTLFCGYYPTGGPSSNFYNCSSGNQMD